MVYIQNVSQNQKIVFTYHLLANKPIKGVIQGIHAYDMYNPDLDVEKCKPYSINDTGYREFKIKLCKIKGRMLTATGRKWAHERHAFMQDFFNRFLAEYEGKR